MNLFSLLELLEFKVDSKYNDKQSEGVQQSEITFTQGT